MHARVFSLLLAPAFLSMAAPAFSATTLYLLPSRAADSFDSAVSLANDGTVVGSSQDFETSFAIFWSKAGAAYGSPQTLSLPSNATGGEARWISADASLIAGHASLSLTDTGDLNQVPLVWSRGSSGGYTALVLPRLGGTVSETTLRGGSANGSRFVGASGTTLAATVWRGSLATGYTAQALALPSGAAGTSQANSVSSNGARAVGYYETATGTQAVVWTEVSGLYSALKLKTLAGGANSVANVISTDGTLAAGESDGPSGLRPATWNTGSGDVTALGTLTGSEATVLTVSENNAWLGGRATNTDTFQSTAVLWNSGGTVFELTTLASNAGAAFSNFTPESVTGVHFVSNGLYTIAGTGTNADGLTQGFVLENLALGGGPTALETWRQAHFGSSAGTGDAADTADPDKDGLPNLLEYASGSDPLAASVSPLTLSQSSGRLTLTFPIQPDATLRYTVEASDDLAVWASIFSADGATLATGGATTKTVTDSVALSSRPRRFLRLVVTLSP